MLEQVHLWLSGDVFLVIFCLLLVVAAATDVWALRIPNALVVALVVLFAIAATVDQVHVPVLAHVVPALVVLAGSTALFFFEKLGGGDVKLLTATVLWLGLSALPLFLIVLAVAGLAVMLFYRGLRDRLLFGLYHARESWGLSIGVPKSLVERDHLPYGVVIAIAGVIAAGRAAIFQ